MGDVIFMTDLLPMCDLDDSASSIPIRLLLYLFFEGIPADIRDAFKMLCQFSPVLTEIRLRM